MAYDRQLVVEKLRRWEDYTSRYQLPTWESLPNFGLYMDQVVVLLQQYLDFIPTPTEGKDSFVTAAAINNYVRLKLMPPPVKKKYGRIHVAYLIMILTLKLSLSISEIRQLLPAGLAEEEARALYGDFCARFDRTRRHFGEKLRDAAQELEDGADADAGQLVMEYSLSAACCALLAGKLIRLEEPS